MPKRPQVQAVLPVRRYPLREPCAICDEEVLLVTHPHGGRPMVLGGRELLPAPCPRCKGRGEECYLCESVVDAGPDTTFVMVSPEGWARVAPLRDREADALYREHVCSVRAAA